MAVEREEFGLDGSRETVLAGKYRLDSVIGKGGMGVVYRGQHLGTERAIAVKVLRPELMADVTLAKRFVREAKAAAAIQHPNVVDVLDYGVDNGVAFQVLELLEGESLGELLARKGKLSLEVTISVLLPVMHALSMAHERGVVHRDLKPDNVFLARNAHGRVVPKLLDFGIAKLLKRGTDARATLATRVGSAIGTPAYMSPEQASATDDVGTATDVWAIGTLLFECLAGRLPFEAETGSILMARIITEQAPSLGRVAADVPAPLVRVIDRALAAKQENRWPSMADFTAALREAASLSGVEVEPPGASDTATMSLPPPRRPDEDRDEWPSGADDDDDVALVTRERAAATAPRVTPARGSTGPLSPRPSGRPTELGKVARSPRNQARYAETTPRDAATRPRETSPLETSPLETPPLKSPPRGDLAQPRTRGVSVPMGAALALVVLALVAGAVWLGSGSRTSTDGDASASPTTSPSAVDPAPAEPGSDDREASSADLVVEATPIQEDDALVGDIVEEPAAQEVAADPDPASSGARTRRTRTTGSPGAEAPGERGASGRLPQLSEW